MISFPGKIPSLSLSLSSYCLFYPPSYSCVFLFLSLYMSLFISLFLTISFFFSPSLSLPIHTLSLSSVAIFPFICSLFLSFSPSRFLSLSLLFILVTTFTYFNHISYNFQSSISYEFNGFTISYNHAI